MLLVENTTDLLVSTDILEKIAAHLTERDIELIIGDDAFIQTLNYRHRRKNDPTDVLSFPVRGNRTHEPLGSIVISMDKVKEEATIHGHSQEHELALLFTHGLLHLLGHDHEQDEGEMRLKEEEIIRHFELPKSLIVRTEEA